ncbi:MAG TPA: phosphotransferase [Stellaceae bacterium]|nr:phosphotransferase [Stellaceae bacterium]
MAVPNLSWRPDPISLAALLRAAPESARLAASLQPEDIRPLRQKGVAHLHFRLGGTGLLLRTPRPSTASAAPADHLAADHLAYEAASFRRAEASGATPRLAAVLPPCDALPAGALLVEEIVGRAPRLPADLPRLAEALAKLHRLPLPAPERRPPLPDHGVGGPVARTLAVIESQRQAFIEADIPAATRSALEEEIAWARDFAAASRGEQPLALVGTDTHPGNFLLRPDGAAIFVDLEKALYGSPAIDLAHATLFTSTTWDPDVQARLSLAEIAAFYEHYLALAGPGRAAALRPWLAPCRRLTWLRTMMWCTRWRTGAGSGSAAAGEDGLLTHIERRVATFFDPAVVASVRAEWKSRSLELSF